MTVLHWTLALLLGAFGLWMTLLNWGTVWLGLRGRKAPSWIPLLGGGTLALALLIAPHNPWRNLWWVPLLLDWGSIPGLTAAAWLTLRRPRP